jgi:hypothetical protein
LPALIENSVWTGFHHAARARSLFTFPIESIRSGLGNCSSGGPDVDTGESIFREKTSRRGAKLIYARSIMVWFGAATALLVLVTGFIMLINMLI